MTRRHTISLVMAVYLGIFLAAPALAQSTSLGSGLLPDCDKTIYEVKGNGEILCPDGTQRCVTPERYEGNGGAGTYGDITGVSVNKGCGFSDFIQLFVILANWGLGIMAGLAVFFYIYGGFQMMISGGRSEYVDQGKKMITGTTIGVLIMLVAWSMTGFYVVVTTGSTQGLVFPDYPGTWAAKWFGQSQGCRKVYNLEHNQSQCGQFNLHLYCADPIDQDGPITTLQSLLETRGCAVGSIDGCFGPQTDASVRKFQQVNGLTEDGIVNQDIWNAVRDQINFGDCDGPTGCCATIIDETHIDCQDNYSKSRCESEESTFFTDGECSDLICTNL
ncbi:MAG: peptidoglycan-binding protein [bacterium]